MSRSKRANPPVCWICGVKLAQGGWSYVDVTDHDGHVHPAHATCVDDEKRHHDDELLAMLTREHDDDEPVGCAIDGDSTPCDDCPVEEECPF